MDFKNHFDYRNGELFWKYSPNANALKGSKAGSLRKDGYIGIFLKNKYYFAHRIIYEMVVGPIPEGLFVDHKDGCRSNNQPSNLRICTHQQNHFNRGKQVNNKSGYKGVSWHKQKRKWVAQIKFEKKNKFLGFFSCPTAAYIKYCKCAIEYYGDFARL